MRVLVTGAQFSNKGAQSLLFTVVDQFKKKFDDVEFFFVPLDDYSKYPINCFKFNIICGNSWAHEYENSTFKRPWMVLKLLIRNKLKEPIAISDIIELHKVLPTIDVMVDVSGYQLSSEWPIRANERFLTQIDEAKKHGAKIIIMPQSFGPFEYGRNQSYMDTRIRNSLSKADVVFAREREGEELLKTCYHLNNVKLSSDLVLQSPEINPDNIYIKPSEIEFPILKTTANVGIVPNFQTVVHGNESNVLSAYKTIIEALLAAKKEIYIFRHSEDLDLCKKIYQPFELNKKVHLVINDFSVFEYSKFIEQFEFLIASRYHAIVHAYKKLIPCVILGWSVKYDELAALFSQEKYLYNLTQYSIADEKQLTGTLETMLQEHKNETEIIRNCLRNVQSNSCYDICWNLLK